MFCNANCKSIFLFFYFTFAASFQSAFFMLKHVQFSAKTHLSLCTIKRDTRLCVCVASSQRAYAAYLCMYAQRSALRRSIIAWHVPHTLIGCRKLLLLVARAKNMPCVPFLLHALLHFLKCKYLLFCYSYLFCFFFFALVHAATTTLATG